MQGLGDQETIQGLGNLDLQTTTEVMTHPMLAGLPPGVPCISGLVWPCPMGSGGTNSLQGRMAIKTPQCRRTINIPQPRRAMKPPQPRRWQPRLVIIVENAVLPLSQLLF